MLVAGSCAALYHAGLPGFGVSNDSDEADLGAGNTSERTPSASYLAAMSGGTPPTYGLAVGWTSPVNAFLLARGDFDGNGRPDIAALGPTGGNGSYGIHLYLQDATGVLGAPLAIALPEGFPGFVSQNSTTAIGLEPGDLNEDGRTDLVLTDRNAPGLHALVSNAEGGFDWRSDGFADLFPDVPARLADFDGDGHLDAVTSAGAESFYAGSESGYPQQRLFYFGNGLGDFTRHRADEVGGEARTLVIGDYDGDGSRDFVEDVIGLDAFAHTRVHRNTGAGAFLPPSTLGLSRLGYFDYVYTLPAGDFTGDLAEDIMQSSGEHLMVHKQLPDGTIQRLPTLFGAWTFDVETRIVDVDGNGFPDVVVPYRYAAQVWIFLQDEHGLRHPRKIPFAPGGIPQQYAPTAVAVDDFNGDGIMDVAIASARNGVRVLHGSLTPYAGAGGLPGAPTVGTPQVTPIAAWPGYRIDVTVGPPASDGGEPVTGYSVFSVPGGAVDADAGTLATSHRIHSLPENASYTFYARAHNAAGLGPPSALSAPLVLGTPSDPERAPSPKLYWQGQGEGDAENKPWPIVVQLDRPAPPGGLSFDVSVSGGTATAGVDFDFVVPPRITIPEGLMESAAFTVLSLGDMQDEPDETFIVNLTNIQGAAVSSYSEPVTLYDDDQPGTFIALGLTSVPEGDSGSTTAYVKLMISQPQPTDTTVVLSADWCYICDSSDYEPFTSRAVVIPAGETFKMVPVVVHGDTLLERMEHVEIEIESTPFQAAKYNRTTLYIVNDDPLPTLSISDATIVEGNQGQTAMKFTVTLSAPTQDVTRFGARTINGSAIAGSDYVARLLGDLTLEAGQTGLDILVQAVGDVHMEPNETFSVQLEYARGAAIGDGVGTGTLQNDDVPNGISVDDATVVEGNGGGNSQLVFNVRLSEPSAAPVTFDITPEQGSAHAPQDYTATQGLGMVIPAGSTLATFVVPVVRDSEVEAHETLAVGLSNVVGATVVKRQALGRILNDDQPALSIADVTVTERNDWASESAYFLVTLSAPATTPVVFSASIPPGGTTTPGTDHDYAPQPNTFYWPDAPPTVFTIDAGRTSKLVEVRVTGDNTPEPTETFTVQLSAPSGATIADGTAIGTILDTDGQAAANRSAKRKVRLVAPTRVRR
jgi:hypothetical protein